MTQHISTYILLRFLLMVRHGLSNLQISSIKRKTSLSTILLLLMVMNILSLEDVQRRIWKTLLQQNSRMLISHIFLISLISTQLNLVGRQQEKPIYRLLSVNSLPQQSLKSMIFDSKKVEWARYLLMLNGMKRKVKSILTRWQKIQLQTFLQTYWRP